MQTARENLQELLNETIRIRDRIAMWPEGNDRTMRLSGCARDIARLEAATQAA